MHIMQKNIGNLICCVAFILNYMYIEIYVIVKIVVQLFQCYAVRMMGLPQRLTQFNNNNLNHKIPNESLRMENLNYPFPNGHLELMHLLLNQLVFH